VLVGLVLAALVLLAAASGRSGVPGAIALAAVSLLWLRVNSSAEGPLVWSMTRNHGLTATDLGGLAGFGVAVWRGWQGWLRRRSSRDEAPSAEPPQH
jgi:hypothetical protein